MTTLTTGPVLVLPGDTPRDVWLAERRNGIGASDVAAIVGVSLYQGPLRVWLDKTGQLNWDGNAATKWGSRFEDDVLDEFIDHHPELVIARSPGMYADADEPWRRVSLDGLATGDDGLEVIEIKTGQSRHSTEEQWGEPGTDQIPLMYLCQVTWACAIMRARRWRVGFLPLDDLENYCEYTGMFSAELAARLYARTAAFWTGNVLAGIEPSADGLPDTTQWLEDHHRVTRTDKGTPRELPAEALVWQAGYAANHHAVKEFSAAKDEYGNLLRQALLAAEGDVGLVAGNKVVSWKRSKDRTVEKFDEAAFKAAHPGLWAEFTTTVTVPGAPSLYVPGVRS